jgi:hypothetical protein
MIKSVLTRTVIATCTVILVLAFFIGIIAIAKWWSGPDELLPPDVAREVLHPTPTPRLVIHVNPVIANDPRGYSCQLIVEGLTPTARAIRIRECGPDSVR